METSQAVVAVPHPDPEHEDPSNDPSSSSEEGVMLEEEQLSEVETDPDGRHDDGFSSGSGNPNEGADDIDFDNMSNDDEEKSSVIKELLRHKSEYIQECLIQPDHWIDALLQRQMESTASTRGSLLTT